MNIELKPIAESKVRQLGGDVCGVLVRTEGSEVMAVSEHGRCTRLDAGVMGPVSSAPAGDRDEFEKWAELHIGWNDLELKRDNDDPDNYLMDITQYAWSAWQAASAQGCQGAEAVAWDDPAVDPIVSKLYRKFKEWNRQGFGADDVTWCEVRGYVAELLNTQPQPAQQGSVPEGEERLTDIYRRKFFECHDELNNLRSEYHNRTAELEGENEDLRQELQSMRHQPAVPEGWRAILEEALAMMTSQPMTLERQAYAVTGVRSLLSTPTTPQADGWVRCEDRLPTYRDSDEYGDVWVMSKLYGVKKMAWSSVRADFESHWTPTGLKRPQPPKEGE